MAEISLVIPVYNCERTLGNTLKSVRNQKFADFEVILVDDGSSDSSGALCDETASEDGRFRVVHQKNAGASAARNRGIEESKGKWIVFMDSDDEIGPDYLSSLYNSRCERGVAVAGFYEKNGDETKLSVDFGRGEYNRLDGGLYELSHNTILYSHPSPISKIFDAEIILRNNIRFDRQVSLCEDLLFWMEFLCKADRVRLIEPVSYIYLKDNSTLTRRVHPYESYHVLADEFVRLSKDFSSGFDQPDSEESKKYSATLVMNVILSLYRNDLKRVERIHKLRDIKRNYKSLIKENYMAYTPVMKLKKWLFFFNCQIFDLVNSYR